MLALYTSCGNGEWGGRVVNGEYKEVHKKREEKWACRKVGERKFQPEYKRRESVKERISERNLRERIEGKF